MKQLSLSENLFNLELDISKSYAQGKIKKNIAIRMLNMALECFSIENYNKVLEEYTNTLKQSK